jgi:hypothetical protein
MVLLKMFCNVLYTAFLQKGVRLSWICIVFQPGGNFPWYLLHFGAKTCHLLHFGPSSSC